MVIGICLKCIKLKNIKKQFEYTMKKFNFAKVKDGEDTVSI